MLQKIIDLSINNKLVVGLFTVILISWGVYETTRLPIDAVPDITDNQVQVITVSPSLGAQDIERLITFPIEQSCSNIPGLTQIRSFSRFGLSLVTIVFDDDVDLYWARQQISERLQGVRQQIPRGAGSPELAPVSTGLGEIYQYVVRPKNGYENKYDAMQLRTLQDWVVRRQLLGTPGVAEVSSFGGKLKQYEIAVRQEQLKAHNLTITDIFNALEKNNENTGGAYIEKGPTVLYIRSEGLTKTIEDIQQIVVKSLSDGTPVLMRDVANVHYGSAIRYGAMTFNDKGEVAGAVVMMLKGENSSAIVKRVKQRIDEIQKMLPDGVVIEPFLDRTKMVDSAISTVEQNLLEGALIVIFVLVFFLGNVRAGLIVSSVIPLSMLFAIILMNQFGIGGNLMSLGAIDFGLTVDGSVIVVEAILHRLSHSKYFRHLALISSKQMDQEVAKSTGSTIKSAVFSQIIILIVYFPILSLEGIEGKMFKPMAYTIAFAIFGAFLLSVTYVPMMAALFLNKKLSHKRTLTDKLMQWLQRRYRPVLKLALSKPVMILAATFILLVCSGIILSRMGGEFVPQLEEGDFAVETRLLTGSNLSETVNATQQASKILLDSFPEVEKIVTKIGSAEIPTDPMPFEAGDMMVILKNKKQWTNASGFSELSEKMTRVLEQVPGITVGFQFPVQMRFNEMMTGARQDVVCKIYGENLDTLAHYAHRLAAIVQSVRGAINIYEEKITGMPQIVIDYNRKAMAKHGLNVSDVNRIVNTAFAGEVAGQIYEGEKRFDLVVRLSGDARKDVADIENLLVPTAQNTQVPLSSIASIAQKEGINQVQRENTRRRIIVGFNVYGRDVQSIVNELQEKVNARLELPKEYTVDYGGSFENMKAAKSRLAVVVPVALLSIFALLYFAFGSVKQGLLIYTAIPLSAIGGILALWVRDMPFSISAGIGFIALFGVAVLNGILLVSEFNHLRREGWKDVRRIVIHATQSKLRPVLMTALVPAMGFIPMAISTGAGGEVQKPLATVVIGGLVISSLLTLFVLPILYIIFEKGFSYFKPAKRGVLALLVSITFLSTKGQQQITLNAALDSAKKNNLQLKVATAGIDYTRTLERTTFDPDKINIGVEYGQINSMARDNKLVLSQAIQFPTVYKNQHRISRINTGISETTKLQIEADIGAKVKQTYYTLLLMQNKITLFREADSLYQLFLELMNQRFELGDADILEKTTAENQRISISSQVRLLLSDHEAQLELFRSLLNTSEPVSPAMGSPEYHLAINIDSTTLEQSPALQLEQHYVDLTSAQHRLEKSRLLPSITATYNNSTIVGAHSPDQYTEKYFDTDKRFSSFGFGLGIPLFTAQRMRVKAAGTLVQKQMQQQSYIREQARLQLTNQLKIYRQKSEVAEVYRKTLLPNAARAIEAAAMKLTTGDIGFLEWVVVVNQALQVRNEYFDIVAQMNEAAFEIEKITANN
ncbi:MAG: CusA/CzcA family heavy metal efflux RND transporter [Chitinophagaceae bacterium]|nr:CusA/CzcA family heavy metal efflux RND transporter [Chitinophagaceae bacterium]